jgi:hypothetical protein
VMKVLFPTMMISRSVAEAVVPRPARDMGTGPPWAPFRHDTFLKCSGSVLGPDPLFSKTKKCGRPRGEGRPRANPVGGRGGGT